LRVWRTLFSDLRRGLEARTSLRKREPPRRWLRPRRASALRSDRDLARGFRAWLPRADLRRLELHRSAPTRKAITVYDLSATGITWLAIRGDEPLRIMQLLDRLAHHATVIATKGKSYRMRKRGANDEKSDTDGEAPLRKASREA